MASKWLIHPGSIEAGRLGLAVSLPECGFRDKRGWCPIIRRSPNLLTCLQCRARRKPKDTDGRR